MKTRALIIFGLLALIVALPLLLRRETATTGSRRADDHLVVLTPHNESIRNEFGEAFAAWWKQETGRSIHVDWRTPGGTSEIRMVLDAGYKAAEETGRDGIGVDVFFGGGEPDFSSQAKKGRFVPLRVFESQPDLFGEGRPIPETFTGERYYPKDHVWVGTCMSQFGICYNPDVLTRLKVPAPAAWRDLGDPAYAGTLALADPTKSGSVARAFELLVQGEILRALAGKPDDREAALEAGWAAGLQLIQKMSANSRYFTDSASKIPHDVGQGNAAAGMCIDFYGRSYAHELKSASGRPRLVWIAPLGGTTMSADPVAVLKGAPNMEVAQCFAEFCLSPQAQVLWFAKPGTPNGPKERALHRTPIRRDVYTPENLSNSTMPGIDPYHDPGNFTYQRELTGAAFNTLRQLVKVMCIDSHEEMKSAWLAMKNAGMPADAMAVFCDVSIMPYAVAGKGDPRFDGSDPLETAANAARIGEWFRANYRKAAAMAVKRH
jgi:ABC-type Fe3+ transport system substrate-binding protein